MIKRIRSLIPFVFVLVVTLLQESTAQLGFLFPGTQLHQTWQHLDFGQYTFEQCLRFFERGYNCYWVALGDRRFCRCYDRPQS